MGTGYTRNDTANNIADGNVINAADFDGEYDAIEAAFNSSTGHTHDGTAAEGGPITVLGPSQEFVASASAVAPSTNAGLDLGTASLKFKDLYIDGTAYIDGLGGNLLIDTTNALQFRDAQLSISSSADGQLDIAADTTAKITSPEVIVTDDFRLQSDAAILTFGADDDVTVTHVADTGLDVQAASGFTLKLQTGDTTVESGNTIGKISFNAPDEASGTDAILVGAEIEAAAEDTFSSTVNSTALVFKTNTSAAATERMRIKSDGDIVFTGASANMTWDTSADSLDFADGGQAAFGSDDDLVITHSGTAGSITNATGDLTVDVAGDIILDADGADIVFKDDGTQIGKITNASNNLEIHSSVSDADIVFKGNDGGVTITALTLDMSEGGKAIFASGTETAFGGATTITTNDNTTQLTLESTDTDANSGPQLDLYRNSATPADNDYIGRIKFIGKNDAAEDFTGIDFLGRTIDVSDGTEDASLFINVMTGGTTWNRLNITPTELVINEESQDLDFRVESDNQTHIFFIDAANDRIGIFDSNPSYPVHIKGQVGMENSSTKEFPAITPTGFGYSPGTYGVVQLGKYTPGTSTGAGTVSIGYDPSSNTAGSFTGYGQEMLFANGIRFYTPNSADNAYIYQMVMGDSGIVINENSEDLDFRVESDSQTHMLFVDASADEVGIGTSSPDNKLEIEFNEGTTDGSVNEGLLITNLSGTTNSTGNVLFRNYDNYGARIKSRRTGSTTGDLRFGVNDGGAVAESNISDYFMLYGGVGVIVNEESKSNVDFRVESDTATHAIFLDASSNSVGINDSSPDTAARLTVNGQQTIKKTDNTVGFLQIGGASSQGTAKFHRVVGRFPAVNSSSGGTKLIIPFVSQGNLNSNTVMRIMGHSGVFNSQFQAGAFTAEISCGHLTTLNYVTLHTTGNISSISKSGMNLHINFTSPYRGSTADGVFVTIEYMTNVSGYSIDVDNITMD